MKLGRVPRLFERWCDSSWPKIRDRSAFVKRALRVSSYEPHQLDALRRAFDIAWAQICPRIDARRVAREEARISLAGIIFELPKGGNFDPQRLADYAVRVMLGGASGTQPEGQ
jgi:hypothetical protein